MAISKKIINFLEKKKVKFEIIKHKTVYTSFDKAQTLKIAQRVIGKTLVIKFNREKGVVLIPANKNLDKVKLKKLINQKFKKIGKKAIKKIDFVTERWMKKNLKGVKVGAIPPLGNLWKMMTFIDKSLLKEKEIIISGGDYKFSLRIKSRDLLKKLLPDAILGNFSKKKK